MAEYMAADLTSAEVQSTARLAYAARREARTTTDNSTVIMGDGRVACRYCTRYGRNCGRHDVADAPLFTTRMADGTISRRTATRPVVATATPRVPSSVGDPLNLNAVVAALVGATDGATVDAQGHAYTGDGIVVALPEYGDRVITDDAETLPGAPSLADFVAAWVRSVAPAVTVTASPARYFGAWVADGVMHLDVVEAWSNVDRDAAVAAGRARNQIAVWDAGRGVEIPTGGTGETTTTR